MQAFKNPFLILVFSALILCSCHKDGKHKDVVAKNHLPVTGNQEVPPKTTKATGTLNVSYNKKTKVLTYKLTWSQLSGNPIGSHIHGEAAKGVNASVKHDFTAPLPKTISGTYKGSVVVDEVAIKETGLLNGLYYVNLHTALNPGGEIRGQIEFD